MANICTVCGKLIVFDESGHSAEDICRGHLAPVEDLSFTVTITPDYSLVLERIAFALEDISTRLGYLRSIAK